MSEPKEAIEMVEVSKMLPFNNHPFAIRDDEEMRLIESSIRQVGVLVPAIVRPLQDGFYEIIAGHRRKRACELAGIEVMPAVVKKVSYDVAIIMMVDSNLQRAVILPSERARAYKMKLDAIKRQGMRSDLTSAHVGQKLRGKTSRDQIAAGSPDSSSQIQRYLRLNELIPELLKRVDDGLLALTPAVEVSFMSEEEQKMLLITMESEVVSPSLSQAKKMRCMSQQGLLTEDLVLQIMLEQKKPDAWNITLPINRITQYFPRSYTPQRMEETIIRLLEAWRKHREKNEKQ